MALVGWLGRRLALQVSPWACVRRRPDVCACCSEACRVPTQVLACSGAGRGPTHELACSGSARATTQELVCSGARRVPIPELACSCAGRDPLQLLACSGASCVRLLIRARLQRLRALARSPRRRSSHGGLWRQSCTARSPWRRHLMAAACTTILRCLAAAVHQHRRRGAESYCRLPRAAIVY